ncbi:MAG: hypothetical protein AAGC55_27310, partial [Myxococcota bacterium]
APAAQRSASRDDDDDQRDTDKMPTGKKLGPTGKSGKIRAGKRRPDPTGDSSQVNTLIDRRGHPAGLAPPTMPAVPSLTALAPIGPEPSPASAPRSSRSERPSPRRPMHSSAAPAAGGQRRPTPPPDPDLVRTQIDNSALHSPAVRPVHSRPDSEDDAAATQPRQILPAQRPPVSAHGHHARPIPDAGRGSGPPAPVVSGTLLTPSDSAAHPASAPPAQVHYPTVVAEPGMSRSGGWPAEHPPPGPTIEVISLKPPGEPGAAQRTPIVPAIEQPGMRPHLRPSQPVPSHPAPPSGALGHYAPPATTAHYRQPAGGKTALFLVLAALLGVLIAVIVAVSLG